MENTKYTQAKETYLNTSLTLREICSQYHIDRFTFSNMLKSENISTRKKIDCDDTIFEKIDTEEKAYWLGFLYADGSITYNLSRKMYVLELGLASKDLNHIQKFKEFLNASKDIKFREKTKSYRLVIYSKKICEDLILLGCTPKKSLTLIFPNSNQLPKELTPHFLRGYFDGDGSLSIKGNSVSLFLLGTREFLTSVCDIFNIDKKYIKKDKRHLNNTFYLHPNVNTSISILNKMYFNCNVYLDRKRNNYLRLMDCRVLKKLSIL